MDKTVGDKIMEYFIIKIKCGCEYNGCVGPFDRIDKAAEKIDEMHDDPAYVDDSLFVLTVPKGSDWEIS